MCGRYYVDDEMIREIEQIVRQMDSGLKDRKSGDVYPSQASAIIKGTEGWLDAGLMCWGFPQSSAERKRLLINARAETALEKKTFRDSVLHRRCIIPARWFYEWDSSKNKVAFLNPDGKPLYMAGFYRDFGDAERFMILTTQANESVRQVHNRMPLLLKETELEDWIFDEKFWEIALRKTPDKLRRYQEYEQQRLFENIQ